ncbi:MBL fold metallo-hydrolase [Solimonas marina]|uniref:MBL fold metallo-hydrolase n=1 Tax=Solimonas marina TaxID=2714601 RepID=A0A969W740_9GAMM|nr:MBL fold metallo-hydrolase [Solimonas marina]NKF20749.1 MBL fold metallo-hydrolase [Solimonas marina]
MKKKLLSMVSVLVAGVLLTQQAGAAPPPPADDTQGEIVVTLLGTGTPLLLPSRYGNSTLVQAGGLNLVFDAGRGVALRLAQAGVSLGKIDGVFLTHFHSDHLNGLADLWMTGYIPPIGARSEPLDVYGPEGTAHIVNGLMETYSKDISIREADEHVPVDGTKMIAHEFSKDGVILDHDGVKVTAFEVNHGPLIKPSYGYRVDYAGHSVAISGDTKYNPNVIKYGTGTDVLIHEVAAAPKSIEGTPMIQRVMDHHTDPEDAGRVFSQAKPRLAVYSHIVRLARPGIAPVGIDEIVARTRTTYSGPLVVGEDLTRFVIGKSITVIPMYSDKKE